MSSLELPGFWPLTGILFVAVVVRYYILAGLFHWIFSPQKLKWKDRYTYQNKPQQKQYFYEMGWSIVTSVIFALMAAGLLLLWQRGYTPLYAEFSSRDWWYVPASILLALLLHETMYYWLHRWMHFPTIFKWVHKVHHQSLTTSSWTAFSFHPWEGFFQMLMLAVLVMVIPMHYCVLLFLLILMTVSAIINHLGVDLYPQKGSFRKHVIGARHHAMHHEEFNTNFGLYFTFWDRWMKTESEKFE
jgi:Delta7-sterol 5-desaturase